MHLNIVSLFLSNLCTYAHTKTNPISGKLPKWGHRFTMIIISARPKKSNRGINFMISVIRVLLLYIPIRPTREKGMLCLFVRLDCRVATLLATTNFCNISVYYNPFLPLVKNSGKNSGKIPCKNV